MTRRFLASAVLLAAGAASVPAIAEPTQFAGHARIALATTVVQAAAAAALSGRTETGEKAELSLMLEEPALGAEALAVAQVAADGAVEKSREAAPSAPKTCEIGSSCGTRALLGYLVITKDLELPGAPGVALRLLPTKNAVAGKTSAIAFTPRVLGTSWYGLDVAAHF
jgi:hypothetical protein